MSRFDAVVFDLDNTLCRNTHDTTALYEQTFDRVGVEPFGRPDDLWAALDGPPDPDDRIGYLGAGFARLAAQHGRSEVDPLALAAALTEVIDHTTVELLPGASEALEYARANGPVGILTNGPQSRQEQKVRALGLDEMVDKIVYAGDLDRRKPHVDPFEAILDGLNVAPERTLYVGDSLAYDVAGAQNAGLAVAWLRGEDAAGNYDPEYIIDSLDELGALLDQ